MTERVAYSLVTGQNATCVRASLTTSTFVVEKVPNLLTATLSAPSAVLVLVRILSVVVDPSSAKYHHQLCVFDFPCYALGWLSSGLCVALPSLMPKTYSPGPPHA